RDVHWRRPPADHVALVPAVDAGAQGLGGRRLMTAGRREQQAGEEEPENARPCAGTQETNRRTPGRRAPGMPAHRGSPSRGRTRLDLHRHAAFPSATVAEVSCVEVADHMVSGNWCTSGAGHGLTSSRAASSATPATAAP